jgi:hypothetical protein
MSHTTDWTCRSCRAVLGQVRDGALRPCVPVESVDGRGVARVPCPGCGRTRIWCPSTTTAALMGVGHSDGTGAETLRP